MRIMPNEKLHILKEGDILEKFVKIGDRLYSDQAYPFKLVLPEGFCLAEIKGQHIVKKILLG